MFDTACVILDAINSVRITCALLRSKFAHVLVIGPLPRSLCVSNIFIKLRTPERGINTSRFLIEQGTSSTLLVIVPDMSDHLGWID